MLQFFEHCQARVSEDSCYSNTVAVAQNFVRTGGAELHRVHCTEGSPGVQAPEDFIDKNVTFGPVMQFAVIKLQGEYGMDVYKRMVGNDSQIHIPERTCQSAVGNHTKQHVLHNDLRPLGLTNMENGCHIQDKGMGVGPTDQEKEDHVAKRISNRHDNFAFWMS